MPMENFLTALVVVVALLIGIGIGRWSRNDLVNQVTALQESVEREKARQGEKTNLGEMLQPLREEIKTLREQAKVQREAEVQTEALIKRDIESLRQHSETLAKALGGSSVRGTYGEGQLESLMESAGLVRGVHYETQQKLSDDGKTYRPDVTINLPGGQAVQMDSKFPFDAYWEFIKAEDEVARAEYLKRHREAVRDRIKDLNSKNYADLTDGPNFVILFFPFESIWQAAVEGDSSLAQYAAANRVVITTPVTLLSVLRTVSHAWQRNQLAENASRIGTAAENLLRSVDALVEDLNRIGSQLKTVSKTYNAFVTRFDNSFVTSARRLQELTAANDAKLKIDELEMNETKEFQGKAANLIEPNSETDVV